MNIEELRTFCNSLPAVTEDIKWGHDLCFSVGRKMFCVTSLEPPHTVSFKVKEEEFEELSARDGIIPAPYMARNKWVQVQHPEIFTRKEWEDYIRQSYELKKSKLTNKIKKELGFDS